LPHRAREREKWAARAVRLADAERGGLGDATYGKGLRGAIVNKAEGSAIGGKRRIKE